MTLSCLIFLSMAKEIYEDLKRRRSDVTINRRKTNVLCASVGFRQMQWQHLNVGDVIEISRDEVVPADAVIINSSEPLSVCYLDTSSLDGESNLKLRQALSVTARGDNVSTTEQLNLILQVTYPQS